jgi:replicative DNA helicase
MSGIGEKALIDRSSDVLHILSSVKKPDMIKAVLESLEGTSAMPHIQLYKHGMEFFEKHGRFPDPVYLKTAFPDINLFSSLGPNDYSPDLISDLVFEARLESAKAKAFIAVSDGDFKKLQEVMQTLTMSSGLEYFSPSDALSLYEEKEARNFTGVYTGIHQIDELVKGMMPGTVTVVGAPPGQFKSTFAINTAYMALSQGKKVCFVSLEIPREVVYYNLFSRHSAQIGKEIAAEDIHKYALSNENNKEKFVEVVKNFEELFGNSLFVLDNNSFASLDPASLDRTWEAVAAKIGRIDAMFIDYVQLFRAFAPQKRDEVEFSNGVINYLMNTSKSINGGEGMSLFALSQLNREGQKKLESTDGAKGNELTSLAEFNSLDRNAHVVILLYASRGMRNSFQALACVSKNRTGRTSEEMMSIYVDPRYNLMGKKEAFDSIFNFETVREIMKHKTELASLDIESGSLL